jgi:hypothetical protein
LRRKWEIEKPRKMGLLGSCRTGFEPGLTDPESDVTAGRDPPSIRHYWLVCRYFSPEIVEASLWKVRFDHNPTITEIRSVAPGTRRLRSPLARPETGHTRAQKPHTFQRRAWVRIRAVGRTICSRSPPSAMSAFSLGVPSRRRPTIPRGHRHHGVEKPRPLVHREHGGRKTKRKSVVSCEPAELGPGEEQP